METAYICDAIRAPFGRYGGALASVRTDDLAAIPLKALVERNAAVDWNAVDDVVYGCANQAGEDNRNIAGWPSYLQVCPRKSGHNRQSALRLEYGRARNRRAGHQVRRSRSRNRRRRRKHVARAIRRGQSG